MLDSAMFGYSTHSGSSSSGESQRRMKDKVREAGASRRTQRDVQFLEDRFERLSLVCMAMWSLLQDKTNLTEQDLLDRVQTIDLMDGQADGKATKVGVVKCHKCSRPMSERHMRCIYCGAEKRASSAFDRV
ncbi:hypothetical protein HNQ40_000180 [Algisphaera agarilytica]|uniref:Uncharacterized protein n=2 Tax=Algisphaera agarilytica TaxID=1385975 RepID=A0A7X0H383_9BACT|nr:hypothetical protein [Algisphaera agarilytica]